ncbi:MAG: GGDEF domain-containing protein [Candidatus Omnitrophica bacterium]|nr:GGDEF domain-containing protein [Candidatus Omnitrophota bacterium]
MTETGKITEIDNLYRDRIHGDILIRLRVIAPLAIILYVTFFAFDLITFPSQAFSFLNIRIAVSFIALVILGITFMPSMKRHAAWLADIIGTVFISGMALMIFMSNGSGTRYYEGANLVILGLSVANPFYLRHMIGCYLLWLICVNGAMLAGPTHFNFLNFTFADYFMGSTALLVAIMTKFYKDQHYKAFVRQEQLKINEQTLSTLYSRADKLSKTDTLTEINNRRHFFEILNKKISGCEKNRASFYLIIFDVDHFKEINDNYGHAFGDKVLVKVVETVKNNIRSNDVIGRFGGDEFVIIFLDHPTKEALSTRLIKIRDKVKTLGLTCQEKEIPVSVSIGAAKFVPGKGMTEEKLIEKADSQLLQIKATTRGEISVDQ